MTTGVNSWSQTAASNATADSTVNWAEGQAPSSVNDSARAMMASVAKWRDDISGLQVTGGTTSAFTVNSNQGIATTPTNGQLIAFTMNATNAASATLAVDGGTAYPLQSVASVAISAGVMLSGNPYAVKFSSALGSWVLFNSFGNPFNVPIGGGMIYIGTTVPNSSFAFPNGAAISRTTYATLFSLIGTTYGTGDGSTTFNLPDWTGRVIAMKEASASRLTSTYFGGDSTAMGATGGAESRALVTGNLPAYTPSGSVSVSVTTPNVLSGGTSDNYTSVAGTGTYNSPTRGSLSATGSFTGSAQGGSSNAFAIVQPTIVENYIIRII